LAALAGLSPDDRLGKSRERACEIAPGLACALFRLLPRRLGGRCALVGCRMLSLRLLIRRLRPFALCGGLARILQSDRRFAPGEPPERRRRQCQDRGDDNSDPGALGEAARIALSAGLFLLALLAPLLRLGPRRILASAHCKR